MNWILALRNRRLVTFVMILAVSGLLTIASPSIVAHAASFSFTLSAPLPSSITVAQGGTSVASSIDATLVSGTTTTVFLTATGLPSGVTTTFTNNPCNPTCTVTLAFVATSTATLGTATITITARGGETSQTTSLSLTVTSPTTANNFMTGGGFIVVNGARDNFGFVAGFKPGQNVVSGHFNYIDHGTGDHVTSIDVTSYTGSGSCRTFSGPGTDNGQSVSFTVTACDNGEPGQENDTFVINLDNGYSASGPLEGGNIQLHN